MNNIHPGCPALMSDGHNYTEYVDSDVTTSQLQKELKITNNNDFREYLQKNATTIMNNAQKHYSGGDKCVKGKEINFPTSQKGSHQVSVPKYYFVQ